MMATIGSEIRVRVGDLSDDVVRALEVELRVPNPKYVAAERRTGRPPVWIPEYVCGYRRDGEDLCLPRGVHAFVRRALQWLPVEWSSEVAIGEPLECEYGGTLRPYQAPIVDEMLRRVQGLVVAPCGSGKTEIGLAAIARAGREALVLVHTKDLLEQWRARIKARFGVEAGQIGSGKATLAPVTVATVQTLARWGRERVSGELARFGVLVCDECHHVPAETWALVVGAIPARHRWGLTATPNRQDGLGALIQWVVGPEIARVRHGDLSEAGAIVPAEVRQVRTGFAWDGDATEQYGQLMAALVEDPERNALVARLACDELDAGGSVLILSQRVAHCEALAAAVGERHEAVALTGALGARKRADAIARLQSGELRCVVATQLADEGLDVPCLSCLILATPSRAAGRTQQRVGRIMRPAPGKAVPVCYDLVDAQIGVLANQARARRRALRDAGCTVARGA